MGLNGDQKETAELGSQLYSYLAEVQRLRAQSSPSAVDLIDDGRGFWFHELPSNPAIRDTRSTTGSVVLSVRFPAKLAPPELTEQVRPWLDGPFDRPSWEPKLRPEVRANTLGPEMTGNSADTVLLTERPEIAESAKIWLESWRAWSYEELQDGPARKLYRLLEAMRLKLESRPDDYQIVIELGCLSFVGENNQRIRRHIVRIPTELTKNDDGEIELKTAGMPIFDVDAIPLTVLPSAEHVEDSRRAIQSTESEFTNPEVLGPKLKDFTYHLPGYASFLHHDTVPGAIQNTFLAWAPAVVLRPVEPRHHVGTLEYIAAKIRHEKSAPKAILPNHLPNHEMDTEQSNSGSILDVGNQTLSTSSISPRQIEALRHSGTEAPTVILSDPNNDKEAIQTAALTLEHLLALGKRVLITGESGDRLAAIHNAVAVELRPLVAVCESVENSQSSLASVQDALSKWGELFTVEGADLEESDLLGEIQLLIEQQQEQKLKLVSLREFETSEHEIHGVVGTIPRIAEWHREAFEQHGWLELHRDAALEPCPISNADFARWLRLMRNKVSAADIQQFAELNPTVGLDGVATEKEFEDLLLITEAPMDTSIGSALNPVVVNMRSDVRRDLLKELLGHIETIQSNDLAAEIDERIIDPDTAYFQTWAALQSRIALAMGQIYATHVRWSHLPVEISMDLEVAVAGAQEILDYVHGGRPLRLSADGQPLMRIGTPKVLSDNADFFSGVSVGGKPPVSADQLRAFLDGAEAWRLLNEVDNSWPPGTPVAAGSTVSDRLAWHNQELGKLNAILDSAKRLHSHWEALYNQGYPTGASWKTVDDVDNFIAELDAVDRIYRQAEAQAQMGELEQRVESLKAETHSRSWATPLLAAIQHRSPTEYAEALDRRMAMVRWDAQLNWLGDVRSKLRPRAPNVVAAMEANPADPEWDRRADTFDEAWRWAAVGAWLKENEPPEPQVIARRIDFIEDQLRNTVSQLANLRARRHAVQRLRHNERTTAGDAETPAWLVPMASIADNIELEKDSFDVVLVDGASETGLHGVFLQYLAPKLVVIGDGMHRASWAGDPGSAALGELAHELLPKSYEAQWTQPETSLFDDFAWRFGNIIELSEDRTPRPKPLTRRLADGETPELLTEPISEDEVAAPFDSLFEQRVFNRLAEEGFTVEPHFESHDYRINLLVHGENASLAVEIADDRWDGPVAYAAQLKNKRKLERAGWIFHRISEAEYISDPYSVLAGLRRRLVALNIAPGAASAVPVVEAREDEKMKSVVHHPNWAPVHANAGAVAEPSLDSPTLAEPMDLLEPMLAQAAALVDEPFVIDLTGKSGDEVVITPESIESRVRSTGAFETDPGTNRFASPQLLQESVDHEDSGDEQESKSESVFAPYTKWRPVHRYSLDAVTSQELSNLVAEAVAVEGPIKVEKLFKSILKYSSTNRLSRKARLKLNQALQTAVVQNLIEIEHYFGETDVAEGWASVRGTEVVARRRGGRKLSDIPPREIAVALDLIDDDSGDCLDGLVAEWNLGRPDSESKKYLQSCNQLRTQG